MPKNAPALRSGGFFHVRWDYLANPTVEPVSYSDMKAQLRLDNDDERDLILAYIIAARMYGEADSQRTFIQRQIQLTHYDSEPPFAWVQLPRGPVVSIDAVTDGYGNAVSSTTYELRRMGNQDFLYWRTITWPFSMTYTAGFAAAAAGMPADICIAIKLHAAHLWDNRSATMPEGRPPQATLLGLDAIYGQYRPRGVIG